MPEGPPDNPADATATAKRIESLFVSARAHYQNGDFDCAIADLSHVIDHMPDAPAELIACARFNRGVCYEHRGRPGDRDRAIADYSHVIDDMPDAPAEQIARARFNRGRCYEQRGRPGDRDRALADYSHVIDHMPDAPAELIAKALSYRAGCHLERSNPDAAAADAQRVLTEFSGYPVAVAHSHIVLAAIALAEGDLDAAAKHLRPIRELVPDHLIERWNAAHAWDLLARMLMDAVHLARQGRGELLGEALTEASWGWHIAARARHRLSPFQRHTLAREILDSQVDLPLLRSTLLGEMPPTPELSTWSRWVRTTREATQRILPAMEVLHELGQAEGKAAEAGLLRVGLAYHFGGAFAAVDWIDEVDPAPAGALAEELPMVHYYTVLLRQACDMKCRNDLDDAVKVAEAALRGELNGDPTHHQLEHRYYAGHIFALAERPADAKHAWRSGQDLVASRYIALTLGGEPEDQLALIRELLDRELRWMDEQKSGYLIEPRMAEGDWREFWHWLHFLEIGQGIRVLLQRVAELQQKRETGERLSELEDEVLTKAEQLLGGPNATQSDEQHVRDRFVLVGEMKRRQEQWWSRTDKVSPEQLRRRVVDEGLVDKIFTTQQVNPRTGKAGLEPEAIEMAIGRWVQAQPKITRLQARLEALVWLLMLDDHLSGEQGLRLMDYVSVTSGKQSSTGAIGRRYALTMGMSSTTLGLGFAAGGVVTMVASVVETLGAKLIDDVMSKITDKYRTLPGVPNYEAFREDYIAFLMGER